MFRSIITAAALVGFAASAHAAVVPVGTLTMYTSLAEFQAAVAAMGETVNEDNFDTLGSSLGGSVAGSAGDIGYVASAIKYDTGALDKLARTGTGSDYALTTAPVTAKKGETYPGDILDFSSFSTGVNAAGATVSALGSSSAQLEIYAEDETLGFGHLITLAPGTNFVGFISTGVIDDFEVFVRLYPANVQPVVTGLYLAAPATVSAVPEPAAWAMMIGGFGMAGAAVRRKKTRVTFA